MNDRFLSDQIEPRAKIHGHSGAWAARPEIVKELIARGASVSSVDAQNRTALQLAVKACIDSYWTDRRSPASVRLLLEAGASTERIELPTGYDEIDVLLRTDWRIPSAVKQAQG